MREPGGRTLTLWRRRGLRAHVIGYASVSPSGVANDPQTDHRGHAGLLPRFVTPSLLTWHIQRQGYVRQIAAGRLVVADRLPAGAALSTGGYARSPTLAATTGGAVVAAWVQNDGAGNALVTAARQAFGHVRPGARGRAGGHGRSPRRLWPPEP